MLRLCRFALCCSVVALVLSSPAWCQGDIEVLGPGNDDSRIADEEVVSRLGKGAFRTLQGSTSAVRYTSALDRAHHLLARLEVLGFYFDRWGGFPIPMGVYIMDRAEWKLADIRAPYGLPLRTGPTAILAPSAGDDKTVLLWQELLGTDGLPNIVGQPIYGTKREAASLLASDTLLQVEATRGFVERTKLGGREPWLGDLMAHVVAGWVFDKHEAARTNEIDKIYSDLEKRYAGLGRVGALAQFSPNMVHQGREGIETWLWYQGQFRRGARIILSKGDKKTVPKLLKLAERDGGLRVDELVSRYPQLSAWISGFAAKGSAPESQ